MAPSPNPPVYVSKTTKAKLRMLEQEPGEAWGRLIRRAVDIALARLRVIPKTTAHSLPPRVQDRGLRYGCGCPVRPQIEQREPPRKVGAGKSRQDFNGVWAALPVQCPEHGNDGDLDGDAVRLLIGPSVTNGAKIG